MDDRGHQVASYDDVATLAVTVARFVADSVDDGLPVLVVSRDPLRERVERLLGERGLDPDRLRRDGGLRVLDAEETLGRFLVDGRPDPRRFAETVASVVPPGSRGLAAFGEMVALLWERDEVLAALELERLWNTAVAEHSIRLLCAYPADLLSVAQLGDVAHVCDLHDGVSLIGDDQYGGTHDVGQDAATSSVHLPVPAAIGSVRRFVREALTSWGLEQLVGDAVLVTSELATNAVAHGHSPFRASLVRVDGGVRIDVEDGSSTWPQRHDALPGDQDGRGMAIVEALTRRSGCIPTPSGKVAWAELSA